MESVNNWTRMEHFGFVEMRFVGLSDFGCGSSCVRGAAHADQHESCAHHAVIVPMTWYAQFKHWTCGAHWICQVPYSRMLPLAMGPEACA